MLIFISVFTAFLRNLFVDDFPLKLFIIREVRNFRLIHIFVPRKLENYKKKTSNERKLNIRPDNDTSFIVDDVRYGSPKVK